MRFRVHLFGRLRAPKTVIACCGVGLLAAGVAAAGGASRTTTTLPLGSATSTVVQAQPPAGSCHATGAGEFSGPDPDCTPGARSPAVTQSTIDTTICRTGYTRTIRPPVGVMRAEKTASLAAYGDTQSSSRYEYDHLISLELGGAPNDPRNLWPEPGTIPNPKDRVENRLHRDVCDHRISLLAAQREIAVHWVGTYHHLFG